MKLAVPRIIRLQSSLVSPLGKVLAIFGVSMLIPTVVAIFSRDNPLPFLLPAAGALAVGFLCWRLGDRASRGFKPRHASLLVMIIWFVLPLIGALPLLQYTGYSLSDAYFEAVSGLTASGATVLSGIDELPAPVKLWRGVMSWLGGMGLIVLAVAILPNLGLGGRQLMRSEITGPSQDSDLTPQINETAKGLWTIYASLTALCMLCYWIAGMDLMDAVVHAMTTLALGGFSNHDASFGFFDSPAIEGVAIVFMVIAGFNFATHFAMTHKFMHPDNVRMRSSEGRLARVKERLDYYLSGYRHDVELLPYLLALLLAVAATAGLLYQSGAYASWGEALRYGAFNTISIITTTGYVNTDFYAHWPLYLSLLILMLANFCSCSGSTGGGIKMVRALTFFRRTRVEQTRMLHQYSYTQVKIGGSIVSEEVVSSIFFFVLAYMATIVVTTFLLLASDPGLDLVTSMSAAIASVSNTGPGLGDVGPGTNYAVLNPVAINICSLAMILGRLEFLIFLLVFSRDLWR